MDLNSIKTIYIIRLATTENPGTLGLEKHFIWETSSKSDGNFLKEKKNPFTCLMWVK